MALRITGSVIGEPITSSFSSATGMWTSQEVAALQKDGIWQVPTSYSLTASASNVNEGSFITATLTTTGLANGTVIPYVITGSNVFANDFTIGSITGNFVIQNNSNTISFTANADITLEYAETFTITAGTASANIIINDTSFPNDIANVVLLLHGNGTNNSQNNTFLDSSSYSLAITRNGNSTQGTFTPYGTKFSTYFPSETGIYFAPQSYFEFANSNNTIECWYYPTVSSVAYNILIANPYGVVNSLKWGLSVAADGRINFYHGTGLSFFSSNTVNWGKWNHIAMVTDISAGNTTGVVKFFVNGNFSANTGVNLTAFQNSGENIWFNDRGNDPYSTTYSNYISNFRWVRDMVYTGNTITIPTDPLTAITNTKLLTHNTNRFVDTSGNNLPLTLGYGSTVEIQKFSPFRSTTTTGNYTENTYSGSAYFDGTGDYLSIASAAPLQLGTGDFTIEFWWNGSASGAFPQNIGTLVSSAENGTYRVGTRFNSTNYVYFARGNGTAFDETTYNINVNDGAWHHIACVRNSGVIAMYVDGIARTAATGSANNSGTCTTSNPLLLGYQARDGTYATGYISNARIVKGTAVYTGNFTPPTAPVTAIGSTSAASYSSTANVNVTFPEANTSLLCNFTNAGIIDNAMMFNLETVADAKISSTQSKFGGTSMFFDGTGDYLAIPSNTTLALGSNDFTIECWVYIQTSVANNGIFHLSTSAWPAASSGIALSVNGASGWGIYYNGTSANGGTQPSLNTWYHTALVRSGTSLKLYVNGAATITVTDSASYTGTFLTIGGYYSTSYLMAGYIDDFRITKGYARYTTNFATPTAEFLDY